MTIALKTSVPLYLNLPIIPAKSRGFEVFRTMGESLCSMFSSYNDDEFLYDVPHYKDIVQQNLTSAEASLEGSNSTKRMGKGKRLKSLAAVANNNYGNGAGYDGAKKIRRKEMERQRRQQMSKLCEKLRSLLPLESIKGKRAASDHMNEAVSYIKYLKKKVQELGVERDKLKKLSNKSGLHQRSASNLSDNRSPSNCVAVHAYWGGVEIVIKGGFGDESWHLSTMMQVILEEGLDAVCCISGQTNEGFLHSIQSEVRDPTQLDLPRLQTKLNDLISY